ncbi:MAG: hypothetical protein IJY39_04215 [Clostridia bacterium]|nr:hypothetical protein [Clostridia bacterium]
MYVITDCRIGAASIDFLKKNSVEPILLPSADYLESAVASHTDMLMFLGFGRLFCHRKYVESNRALVERIASLAQLELTVSEEPTGERYPYDVLFNACILGNRLICNKNTVSKLILDAANESGYEIIHVPQGYAKCSVCAVSDNAIITADKAIAKACRSAGIDVLTVTEGHISLPPYDYGFIGGAGGLCGNKVCFCGSINKHPDGERIKKFCEENGKIAVSLSDGELQDVGSLFFIGGNEYGNG